MGKHKFVVGGLCEHCGLEATALNAQRVDGKLPDCPDAPDVADAAAIRAAVSAVLGERGGGSGGEGDVDLREKTWQSVLRFRECINDGGEREVATALVYDVFEGELYFLINDHTKLANSSIYELVFCDEDGEFFQVVSFKKEELEVYASSKEHDFQILKVKLPSTEWDVQPGRAVRLDPPAPKRPKREVVAKKQVSRAALICKTPSFAYAITSTMAVHVYGFPAAIPEGRWIGTTSITAVGKHGFQLQQLSAPGLSGGAVIATPMGKVVGYMFGAQDVIEDGAERRFGCYAFNAANLPDRPSSPRTSSSSSNDKP